MVDKKVSIVSANGLVRLLQRNADSLSGHVKFAKLIINLCKQYGHELHGFAASMLVTAVSHKSMMKTAVCRAVKNL